METIISDCDLPCHPGAQINFDSLDDLLNSSSSALFCQTDISIPPTFSFIAQNNSYHNSVNTNNSFHLPSNLGNDSQTFSISSESPQISNRAGKRKNNFSDRSPSIENNKRICFQQSIPFLPKHVSVSTVQYEMDSESIISKINYFSKRLNDLNSAIEMKQSSYSWIIKISSSEEFKGRFNLYRDSSSDLESLKFSLEGIYQQGDRMIFHKIFTMLQRFISSRNFFENDNEISSFALSLKQSLNSSKSDDSSSDPEESSLDPLNILRSPSLSASEISEMSRLISNCQLNQSYTRPEKVF